MKVSLKTGEEININTANTSTEDVAEFKHFQITEQIKTAFMMKSRHNSGNTCNHSVRNLQSSCLTKNLKIKIYRELHKHIGNIILVACIQGLLRG
jgi:hypothetical protein